jgi:N-acyl-D-aspartate/D-glutamate deacylase
MLDLVIRGGLVADGTGAPLRQADVGVSEGRVVQVGATGSARRVIDVDGQIVAPGFIDVHTHVDAQACWDSTLSPSPLHGVTTMLAGNCGFTLAPTRTDNDFDYLVRMLSVVEGMPLDALRAGVVHDWNSTGEYLERFGTSLAVNTGFMVGHSALRRVVMQDEATKRQADAAETEAMARLLRAGLAQGALGFSSSWGIAHLDGEGEPVPSRLASAAELVTLAAQCRDFPGTSLEFLPLFVDRFDKHQADLLADMSKAAQRPLNWNVLRISAEDAGAGEDALRQSDHARNRGGRVIALTMPIPSRARFSFLTGFALNALPGWDAVLSLPLDRRLTELKDRAVRCQLRDSTRSLHGPLAEMAAWDNRVISETFDPTLKHFEGQVVADIARSEGKEPLDALLDIVCADELRTTFCRPPSDPSSDDWFAIVDACRSGRAIIGASDAGAHLDFTAYFDYPVFMLAESVRRYGVLGIEEAVQMVTSTPADLYGLHHRGRLIKDAWADIVVFDPDGIASGSIHTRVDLPGGAGRLYAEPSGIAHVIVNGEPIVEGRTFTEARPGSLIRAGRDTVTPSLNS